MKRFITVVLSLAMLLTLTVTFCSCGKDEEAPAVKRVKLTATNFKDYIAVNATYDYQMVHLYRDASGKDHYDIFCTITVATAPKGNYTFENAEVEYLISSASMYGWTSPISSIYDEFSTYIGADGSSEATITIFRQDETSLSRTTFDMSRAGGFANVVTASGTVIIPAE